MTYAELSQLPRADQCQARSFVLYGNQREKWIEAERREAGL